MCTAAVQVLDLLSNDIFITALGDSGVCGVLVSEEDPEPIYPAKVRRALRVCQLVCFARCLRSWLQGTHWSETDATEVYTPSGPQEALLPQLRLKTQTPQSGCFRSSDYVPLLYSAAHVRRTV